MAAADGDRDGHLPAQLDAGRRRRGGVADRRLRLRRAARPAGEALRAERGPPRRPARPARRTSRACGTGWRSSRTPRAAPAPLPRRGAADRARGRRRDLRGGRRRRQAARTRRLPGGPIAAADPRWVRHAGGRTVAARSPRNRSSRAPSTIVGNRVELHMIGLNFTPPIPFTNDDVTLTLADPDTLHVDPPRDVRRPGRPARADRPRRRPEALVGLPATSHPESATADHRQASSSTLEIPGVFHRICVLAWRRRRPVFRARHHEKTH